MKTLYGLMFLVLVLTATSLNVEANASRVAVGDINGDGIDDLLIATTDFLVVAEAVGDGTFMPGERITLDPGQPIEASFIELLGNGQLFTMAAYSDLGGVQVNRGNNQFPIRSYGMGVELSRIIRIPQTSSSDLIFTSFDTSEKGILIGYKSSEQRFVVIHDLEYSAPVQDVAFSTLTDSDLYTLAVLHDQYLNIYAYDASSGFATPVEIQLTDNEASKIESGSINGNALPDLLLWNPESSTVSTVSWISGSSWKTTPYTLHTPVSILAVGDVDGDGFADLPSIASAQNEIIFYHNQNGSTFASSSLTLPFSMDENEEAAIQCGNFSTTQNGFVVVAPDSDSGPEIYFVPVDNGSISTTVSSTISTPPEKPCNYANVVIRDASNPELIYRSERIPDWTTGATIITNKLSVQHEQDTGSGLALATDIIISGIHSNIWPSEIEVVPNQQDDDQSLFFLTPSMPITLLKTLITPTGGTHGRTVTPVLESRESASIYYRKNGGSWKLYDPDETQIYFYRSGSLDAYATYGPFISSMASASYIVDQPYDADSDYDGLPDFVEEAYGLNPLDGDVDSDDDGWRDLDELIRETDPLDADSFPADSDIPDGDGWSDFDETLRQTDPGDPESNPTVSGLEVPEAVVPIEINESALNTPTGVDGSSLKAKLLTGYEIDSATLDNASSLRMRVDHPSISGYTDGDDAEIVLLTYVPRKTYDPQIDGDESTTAEEWIKAYADEMHTSLFEKRTALMHDAETTAVVLALARFMEQALSLTAPNIIWTASGTVSQSDINRLEQTVNLDEAASYLTEHISETSLPGMVRAYIEWGKTEDIRGTIIERLAWILHGWTPDESDAPDALPAKTLSSNHAQQPAGIDFTSILDELDTLFLSIPTLEIELEGVLAWDERDFVTLVHDGIAYGFNDEGATLSTGSEVRIKGRVVVPSPYSDIVWVKMTALEQIDNPLLSVNTIDSDNNGLADQWEAFYFPSGALPTDDPDEDGYTNKQEYDGYSDPTDVNSIPSASGTRIRNWFLYE